jgi:hypothetical protein
MVLNGCSKQMLNVKRQFKKLKEKAQAFVTPSPPSDLAQVAAEERRGEALTKFAQAVLTILIGVWLAPVFFGQANLVIAVAGACSLLLVIQGFKLWFSTSSVGRNHTSYTSPSSAPQSPQTQKSPTPARQDARTQQSPKPTPKSTQPEVSAAQSFRDLQQQGWKITCNLPIPNLGNVDVFLQSPNKNSFIVNVQSYQGEVFFDEGVLRRRNWSQVSDFEQDLLQLCIDQALAVKKMKRLRSVTPVLCFSEATLCIETVNNKARDVYVVKKEALVRKLLRLDKD